MSRAEILEAKAAEILMSLTAWGSAELELSSDESLIVRLGIIRHVPAEQAIAIPYAVPSGDKREVTDQDRILIRELLAHTSSEVEYNSIRDAISRATGLSRNQISAVRLHQRHQEQ